MCRTDAEGRAAADLGVRIRLTVWSLETRRLGVWVCATWPEALLGVLSPQHRKRALYFAHSQAHSLTALRAPSPWPGMGLHWCVRAGPGRTARVQTVKAAGKGWQGSGGCYGGVTDYGCSGGIKDWEVRKRVPYTRDWWVGVPEEPSLRLSCRNAEFRKRAVGEAQLD